MLAVRLGRGLRPVRPEIALVLMTAAVAVVLGLGAAVAAVLGPAWPAVVLALMALANAVAAAVFRRALR